jgi:hypothetical protein
MADAMTCAGLTATGPCEKPARYAVGLTTGKYPEYGACGSHLAQMVKYRLSGMNTVTVRKAPK